jgi:hypothetical protein
MPISTKVFPGAEMHSNLFASTRREISFHGRGGHLSKNFPGLLVTIGGQEASDECNSIS